MVIAYSLTPDQTAATLEHKAPSVEKRLAALAELAERGWNVGLRFDPVLYELRYQDLYQRLFEDVFDRIPGEQHSLGYVGTVSHAETVLSATLPVCIRTKHCLPAPLNRAIK